ncbi:MAG: hypothetical protein E6Q66_04695 [Pedobacter sp.]|nr:MAG: hypothetical protein E6Q66_04695 [Pedobacter sp.]
MLAIKIWLDSPRDYVAGISLYELHGTNSFLKKRFRSGPDAYNKQKLAEELQKLVGKVSSPPKLEEEGPKPPQANLQEDQAKYLALLRKRDDIVRQIERNKAVLDLSTSQPILFETAKQLLKLHQKKCEIWTQIDFFQAHGYFETPEKEHPVVREKEKQLLHQAISKAKKRLKNSHCKNKTKTEQLLQKHQKRLQALIGHASD